MPKTTSNEGAIRQPFPRCALSCELLAESDHRTANHFALLASYVRLKGAELEKMIEPTPVAVSLFVQSIQGQIQSVARLQRLLSDHEIHAAVELYRLLPEVYAPFATMYAHRIAITEDFDLDCVVRPDQSLPISQIVVEAIINSVKHARTDDGIVIILVRCQAIEGGVRVEISDNGGGLPDAFVPETDDGLGFRLMRAHAKAAGGMITFETSRCGLKVELTVPIDRTP